MLTLSGLINRSNEGNVLFNNEVFISEGLDSFEVIDGVTDQ